MTCVQQLSLINALSMSDLFTAIGASTHTVARPNVCGYVPPGLVKMIGWCVPKGLAVENGRIC